MSDLKEGGARLTQKLTFHERGVQCLAFSNDSRYMVSVGVQKENTLAVWNLSEGLVRKSAVVKCHSVNQVRVDPYVENGVMQFVTVGGKGSIILWRMDILNQQLQFFEVPSPEEFQNNDFTSVTYTPYLPSPYSTYLILIGSSDGALTAYDHKKGEFIDNGAKKWAIKGEVSHSSVKNDCVVLASATGSLARYSTST